MPFHAASDQMTSICMTKSSTLSDTVITHQSGSASYHNHSIREKGPLLLLTVTLKLGTGATNCRPTLGTRMVPPSTWFLVTPGSSYCSQCSGYQFRFTSQHYDESNLRVPYPLVRATVHYTGHIQHFASIPSVNN